MGKRRADLVGRVVRPRQQGRAEAMHAVDPSTLLRERLGAALEMYEAAEASGDEDRQQAMLLEIEELSASLARKRRSRHVAKAQTLLGRVASNPR